MVNLSFNHIILTSLNQEVKFESLENAKALDQVEKGWSWFLLHLRSKSYQAREKKNQ